MNNRILVLYGSYRSVRQGIRLAQFVVDRLRRRGDDVGWWVEAAKAQRRRKAPAY